MSTNIKALQLVKDKMGSSPNNVLRNLVVSICLIDNNYWINSFKLCKILDMVKVLNWSRTILSQLVSRYNNNNVHLWTFLHINNIF